MTLVVAGLLLAYVATATPTVTNLVPVRSGGMVSIGMGVWAFAMIAGGGLLVAGTSRLADALATLRRRGPIGGPAMRALGSMSDDEIAVVERVVPGEGRPIPELVVGQFGAAVVHALPSASLVRHGPSGWQAHSDDGWLPAEDPVDAAARDADRVRRWLAMADLDFVVRVYAALVVEDVAVDRSPACAVVGSQQLAAWIASLPRQRTLTAGRRGRLLAMSRARLPAVTPDRSRGW